MIKTTYTENLGNKQLLVARNFNAPVKTVWKAWTDPKLLDEWWAPKPWKAETTSMDFKNGGTWIYSMNGPEGEKHWARADFEKIDSFKSYEAKDSFCDENGTINHEIPGMHWLVKFIEDNSKTKVEVIVTFESVEALQTIVQMGFKEGFSMAHENLDQILTTL